MIGCAVAALTEEGTKPEKLDPEIAVIFPWLELREPTSVCGIEFLPRDVAIARAGAKAGHVAAATSYFFEPFVIAPPGEDREDQPVDASVVFPTGHDEANIEIATNALAFCTIAANSNVSYANSTVFTHHWQRLGGDPAIYSRTTRRMHGRAMNGALVSFVREVRPAWCGRYHQPDEGLLRAIEGVIKTDAAKQLRDAFESLMAATSDADNISPDLEHSMYAHASGRLLHRDGDGGDNYNAQLGRGKALLAPLLVAEDLPADDPHIMKVWQSVRTVRNNFWHPKKTAGVRFEFEQQHAVHPKLIAFQMVKALVVASLVDLGAVPATSKTAKFVPGIEDWIAHIDRGDARDPQDASNVGKHVAHYALRQGVRETMAALERSGGFAQIARSAEVGDANDDRSARGSGD